jgi:hypothetical protein
MKWGQKDFRVLVGGCTSTAMHRVRLRTTGHARCEQTVWGRSNYSGVPAAASARCGGEVDTTRRRREPGQAGTRSLLRQLFHSCLTSGLIAGAAVLVATLRTTQDRPHHK